MAQPEQTADYIVVGGGLTGCVVAARLSQSSADRVVLLEAGPDASDRADTKTVFGAFALGKTELNWAFKTQPDANTAGRSHQLTTAKVLGGGSVLNYGGWSHGDAADYNDWAKVVDDQRWGYEKQLPYFKKTEDYFDPSSPGPHGVGGVMHIHPVSADKDRVYGLREPLAKAYEEGGGKSVSPDGAMLGRAELVENWRDGQRQPAHQAYDMRRVAVMTGATVERVAFTGSTASGVILTDGRRVKANKEVVLAAGTLCTPQILMLSGIGPPDTLAAHGISLVVSAPDVGQNLTDHFAFPQRWRVKNAEHGMAMGTPKWAHEAYTKGLPADWVFNDSMPPDRLQHALEEDQRQGRLASVPFQAQTLLAPGRVHLETMPLYIAFGASAPPDGTLVSTITTLMLPTSRGSVSITSASISDPPAITAGYYSTESDQKTLIYGARRVLHMLLNTSAGRSCIESELAPAPNMSNLTLDSTDAEIDERIRSTGMAQAHSAGTAAMGKVVDSELRVYGVDKLRIADASVLPTPIGGHPQATLYALAEQAADIILRTE